MLNKFSCLFQFVFLRLDGIFYCSLNKLVFVGLHIFKQLELLILECFQAGLSWECILNKRENFRAAFDNFNVEKICCYDKKKIDELLSNSGIIRNKLKIHAAVTNAIVFNEIQKEYGSFDSYI
ncbi:MAG: DNA-3-methyladenine glycosylase I, partial [Oscillospiraceae bacterium]|nr:DNA-3-methyladenine glycosylase I [Oscillospiraceae bacterium]